MQKSKNRITQLCCQLSVVAFLCIYCMQVVGLEKFEVIAEIDLVEINADLESDGEEKKASEDIDDHLTQAIFSEQNLCNIVYPSSFFISEMAQKAHLDSGYPPPEVA